MTIFVIMQGVGVNGFGWTGICGGVKPRMHGISESVDVAVAWKTEVRGEEVDEYLMLQTLINTTPHEIIC